ncbi:hypothetical protein ACM16X_02685 [Haloarcula japonica]|uniref:hypothetical protein n=1 Tax=Haloarcula japonica TaxID=29282 RepID=UPI0039F67324
MERKKQLLREAVDRRKENRRLRKRNRQWRWFSRLFLAVLLVSVVLPCFFFLRVAPMHPEMWSDQVEKKVVVPEVEYDVFQRRYNESVENGFCLFGDVDEDIVLVREVEWVEDPEIQRKGRIRFDCIKAMKKNWRRLLFSSDFNFLGTVHTHPSGAYLSRADARNLGSSWWHKSVKGVFDGRELNFFSYGEPGEALEMSVISFGGWYRA